MNRLNFLSKYLGDYTIKAVRKLKIRDDFDRIYYECSRPLFASNDFGLLNYDYQFWYERAIQFGTNVKANNPNSEAIKTIETIVKKIDFIDAINDIIDNLLNLILIISGLFGIAILILFGFSFSGIFQSLLSIITIISVIIFCITLFLRISKKVLIFERDLEKTVTRRLIISKDDLDKNYSNIDKIFIANVWNNSLKNYSSLSVLFFFVFFKKWLPNLYEVLILALCLVIPECIPEYFIDHNKRKLIICMFKGFFFRHWTEINQEIIERFSERIQLWSSVITGFFIILLIISFAYQNWTAIYIESIVIFLGAIQLFFSAYKK
nr:hypothetical protein [uncultured Methanoregula sp.]